MVGVTISYRSKGNHDGLGMKWDKEVRVAGLNATTPEAIRTILVALRDTLDPDLEEP